MVKIAGDNQIARIPDKTHDPKIVVNSIQVNCETVSGDNTVSMKVVIEEALNAFIVLIHVAEWPIFAIERTHDSQVVHAETFVLRRMYADHDVES